jgi:hypothetical protein
MKCLERSSKYRSFGRFCGTAPSGLAASASATCIATSGRWRFSQTRVWQAGWSSFAKSKSPIAASLVVKCKSLFGQNKIVVVEEHTFSEDHDIESCSADQWKWANEALALPTTETRPEENVWQK